MEVPEEEPDDPDDDEESIAMQTCTSELSSQSSARILFKYISIMLSLKGSFKIFCAYSSIKNFFEAESYAHFG